MRPESGRFRVDRRRLLEDGQAGNAGIRVGLDRRARDGVIPKRRVLVRDAFELGPPIAYELLDTRADLRVLALLELAIHGIASAGSLVPANRAQFAIAGDLTPR
jgi:hypothetical protein